MMTKHLNLLCTIKFLCRLNVFDHTDKRMPPKSTGFSPWNASVVRGVSSLLVSVDSGWSNGRLRTSTNSRNLTD